MDYSIVIPAYNEAQELPKTLASIRTAMAEQTLKGEIIVVDNNSSDKTAHIAKACKADHVVFEPINQIGRARNTGAKASTANFLIFIDADTRIQAPLLLQALEKLQQGTHVGGGSIIEFEGPASRFGRFGIQTWKQISLITNTAAGSFIYCRKDAFDAIGGFDHKFFAGEETVLSHALKRWGKSKKLHFEILKDAPAQTSARKLEWFTALDIFKFIIIAPIAMRSRKLCKFWYNRPKTKG